MFFFQQENYIANIAFLNNEYKNYDFCLIKLIITNIIL